MNRPVLKKSLLSSILLSALLLQSCAPTRIKPSEPPYDVQRVSDLLSNIKKQDNAGFTYYAAGKLKVRGHGSDYEANALIIGVKDPLTIKLEITHFWGRPLFHVVVDRTQIRIISFPDKRFYVLSIGQLAQTNLLPVHLDPHRLWDFGRGFPTLGRYENEISDKPYQITLTEKENDTVQVLDFHPGLGLPFRVKYPHEGIWQSFSDYRIEKDITYARETRIHDRITDAEAEFNMDRIVFNKVIDNSVFELVPPSEFEIITGDQILDTP